MFFPGKKTTHVTALLLSLLLLSCHKVSGSSPGLSPSLPATQKPYIINNIKYYPIPSSSGYVETGIASWYGRYFHGRRTSNGERYDMYGLTAAHKILPMNTMLLVKNLENGRELVVRVNDRGPFVRGRIIDLSYGSAKKLGVVRQGTAKVRIYALAPARNGKFVATPDFNSGQFYVQIGSFLDRTNALRLQNRFRNAGHETIVEESSLGEKIYYRVQVYTGTRLAYAKQAEKALLRKGYSGAFIIARER